MSTLTSELLIKLVDNVTGPAKSVSEALKKAESQIKAIDGAMKNSGASAGFQRQLASLGKSAGDIDNVANAWKNYTRSVGAAENSANWTKGQAQQIRTWEQATIKSLRSVEAAEKNYQRQSQQLANANLRQSERAGERAGVGHMLRNGVIAYAGAHGVMHVGKDILEQGTEAVHEEASIQTAHQPSPQEMDELKAKAREVAKSVPTSNYADNLKVLNETIGAFGDVNHAMEHLKFNQKVASVVHAAAGDKIQADSGEMGQAFARFGEMRGSAMDPERYERENAGLAKAMIFTRGNFNPQEMLNMGAQAHAAIKGYDEDFLTKTLPILAAERGGERTGTGASAFRSTILGKARDAKQAQAWVDAGLVDPSMVTKDSHGGVTGWKAGAVKDTNLALSNPLKWAETVQNPALQKRGVNTDDQMATTIALGTMYRNQMSNQFAEDMSQLQSRNRLHKDSALMDKTMGINEAYDFNLKNDPSQSIKTITSALQDFAQAISSPALAKIGPTLTGIGNSIKSFAGLAQDHPNIAAAAGLGAGAIGLGGSAWFAKQMASGFGLGTSAKALDAAAAHLMAVGGPGGGLPGGVVPAAKSGGGGFFKSLLPGAGVLAGSTIGAGVGGGLMGDYLWNRANDWRNAHPEGYQGLLHDAEIKRQMEDLGYARGPSGTVSPMEPGWSANNQTTSWPMVGKTGATAGVQSPDFTDAGSAGNTAGGVSGALSIPDAGGTGARVGSDYAAGLQAQLQQAIAYAQDAAQQIRNALDFSATPNIQSSGGASAPAPRRQSSVTEYDHGRASAANVWSLS